MKITIPKNPNSSITEEIVIELDNYTILAGENNSGKTNLVKAIMDHGDLKDHKIIYIPAEEIDPEAKETKRSAKGDPFYKLVETILEPIFKTEMFEGLITDFNNSTEKNKFIDDINRILDELGVKKKKLDVKILKEDLKKDIIVKIVKAIVKDSYNSDIDEVELDRIGTGTRRMIVAALIRYYAYTKMKKDTKTLLVFEEPEAYLHPIWKKGLYDALLKLSVTENTKVLITTHDPYFIELGKKQKIYQVKRDPAKKDATVIEEMDDPELLNYKSDSEINYLIFGIPSRTYFLELYESLLSLFEGKEQICESCKKDRGLSDMTILNRWIIKEASKKVEVKLDPSNKNNSLVSKLRQQLGHPNPNGTTVTIPEEQILDGVKELRTLITLKRSSK